MQLPTIFKHFNVHTTYNPVRDWCLILVVLTIIGAVGSAGLAWDYYRITQTGDIDTVQVEIPKRYLLRPALLGEAASVVRGRAEAWSVLYQKPVTIIDPSL